MGLWRKIAIFVLFIAGSLITTMLSAQQGYTGATKFTDGKVNDYQGQPTAWDAEKNQWVDLEQFWLNYAERKGGLTWGRGADYPPYEQVKEFDTFMVEVKQGPCLMEFFHSRWRRANDVRRWDEAFNQYGGCPYVFD